MSKNFFYEKFELLIFKKIKRFVGFERLNLKKFDNQKS